MMRGAATISEVWKTPPVSDEEMKAGKKAGLGNVRTEENQYLARKKSSLISYIKHASKHGQVFVSLWICTTSA